MKRFRIRIRKRKPKEELTVTDFRQMLKSMIEGDRIHWSQQSPDGFLEVLNALSQKSDAELLAARLYADLGMDSVDLWEMVILFERKFRICIGDEVEEDIGSVTNLTVREYLQILNKHLSQRE